jgi:hypothetical protein
MEINKHQIAEVKEAMAKAIRLCERLARSLRTKGSLQQWEKTALIEHNDIISACNKSRFLLDCLPAVQVIELEPSPTELLPPSAPTSVAEPEPEDEQKFCDVCKKHFEGRFDTVCDPCHQLAEEEEAKVVLHRKLARIAELQAKKDKRSTEISQANKQTLSDLKEQVELLESIGYSKLDTKGKTSLTRFKKRIVELEAESASTGPYMVLTV